MEGVVVNPEFWKGRKVFITGHTGFKGGWLSLWLQQMGAEVIGYSLAPPTEPSLFEVARVAEGMISLTGDVRDIDQLKAAIMQYKPEIVIHMAAQPLVRDSYQHSAETFATNVMGTVNLFESVRNCKSVKAVVNVTTDKCYENKEWVWGYRENDPLGGHDPYSSSKACSELVTASYRNSFFNPGNYASHGVALATARAGNVIGGGDWAKDRLIPDVLRAMDAMEVLNIRSPHAIRPWQHVLEPLSGYMMLAERLYEGGDKFAEPWNFSPADEDARSVQWIVEQISAAHNLKWEVSGMSQPHEAHYLKLDSSKARRQLGWLQRWRLETAIEKTLEWHEAWRRGEDMRAYTLVQISHYPPVGENC